jgi:glutathione S-transferase
MTTTRLRILGIHGSPYSRKMLAALRYRRIPHSWIVRDSVEDHDLPRARVFLLPQVIEGEGAEATVRTDSTPILRDLDRQQRQRRVRPSDPVVALLDAILEDFADEWVTKAMFHYRWAFAPDIAQAASILPRWGRPDRSDEEVKFGGAMFAERQIGRLAVVGSNATTAPVIEDSYRRTLVLLSDHLAAQRFLMGGRPGASDFAMYGQLTQLARFDPTPMAIAHEIAPRVVAWVDFVEDLSGLEPTEQDWTTRDHVAPTLRELLMEVGRVYVPFLLANAAAIGAGSKEVECVIDGHVWKQQAFPYQAKCLGWLRDEFIALSETDRRHAGALLAGTGCDALFADI